VLFCSDKNVSLSPSLSLKFLDVGGPDARVCL
jgi:hypothetical protein